MLHHAYKFLSVSALALAALSGPSLADAGAACDLSNGYAITPAAFQQEANACLKGVSGVETDTVMADKLMSLVGEQRASLGKSELSALGSLNEAARLHALDMAVRGYASHTDLEGRSHLDRVRMMERSALIGAFGANIVIVKAGASVEDVQKVMVADEANAANLARDEFDHMGVAAVEANGVLYVVQLFTRVDGQLKTPVPMVAAPRTNLAADFTDQFEPVGWSVVSASGETLMRGMGSKMPASVPDISEGYLQMDVELGNSVYTLRGPAISSSL
ncbi:CAP domain-containing protein [uncultured Hyphomonas sp.]|uniref:CAP domain-containing protein n=1 Tax=uncultured Hyphomonas sp. TaxID=225298 RepID=UPI002AABDF9E|nr:CAP domain-containing protein [uncultured Hyphomonas sp.]